MTRSQPYLFLTTLWVLWFAFAGISQAANPPQGTPSEQTLATVNKIMAVLSDQSLDKLVKRKRIEPIIRARFDFKSMSRRTMAQTWKKATESQQIRFIDLYSRSLANTYLAGIEDYSDERVEIVGEKLKKKKYAQVNTLIIRRGGADIPINYRMLLKKGEWLVYDVVIEGISLISNNRNTYQEIARKDGFDGLLERMETKLAQSSMIASE